MEEILNEKRACLQAMVTRTCFVVDLVFLRVVIENTCILFPANYMMYMYEETYCCYFNLGIVVTLILGKSVT